MKQALATGQIQLARSLGQNFLHDQNQVRRICEAAALSPDDAILEIGPGLGPLTELLAATARTVLAVEKDARLVQALHEHFAAVPHVTVIHDDAAEFLRRETRDWSAWKLVANLPYSATSSILTAVAQLPQGPARITVTVQREVAQRLTAPAGDPAYGVLTVLLQLRYQPRGCFKIPRTCFFPTPEVESSTLTLDRRAAPLLPEPLAEEFTQLVRLSFSQRRKTMVKLLKTRWPEPALEAAFAGAGLPAKVRAEVVTLEQFVQLTRHLAVTPALSHG